MKLNPLILMRTEFDGTGIALNPETNAALALNATGIVIWKALEEDKSEDDIVDIFIEKYQLDKEKAQQDVRAFLEAMAAKGLLI